jgi:hypothetical protein
MQEWIIKSDKHEFDVTRENPCSIGENNTSNKLNSHTSDPEPLEPQWLKTTRQQRTPPMLPLWIHHRFNLFVKYFNKYLLLTEYEVDTVSYGPSCFHCLMRAQAHGARAIKKSGQKRGSMTYGTGRANEVNKMFIVWEFSNWETFRPVRKVTDRKLTNRRSQNYFAIL